MANRRSVLIGLGGLVAGGGALLGTGAFTTVEAERTVNVETAGDASAFLGLEVDDDYDSGSDTVQFDLSGGLNLDALTKWEPMLIVSNNGTQDVDSISFEFTSDSGPTVVDVDSVTDGNNEIGMGFQFRSEFDGSDHSGFDDSIETQSDETELTSGNSNAYDLVVDTRGSSMGSDVDFDVTLTITAESTDNS